MLAASRPGLRRLRGLPRKSGRMALPAFEVLLEEAWRILFSPLARRSFSKKKKKATLVFLPLKLCLLSPVVLVLGGRSRGWLLRMRSLA